MQLRISKAFDYCPWQRLLWLFPVVPQKELATSNNNCSNYLKTERDLCKQLTTTTLAEVQLENLQQLQQLWQAAT